MALRQSIDAGKNNYHSESSNEEDVSDMGTKKDEVSKESNGHNPSAIPHFEDSFNTRTDSKQEANEEKEE